MTRRDRRPPLRGSAPAAAALWLAISGLALSGCAAPESGPQPPSETTAVEWAIAIHGGAGAPDRERLGDEAAAYREALGAALRRGAELLASGRSSLDVVEVVVRMLEDDERFNAGRGAVYNHDGDHELDAAIMEGAAMRCGAVAATTSVRNPVSLARLVMERTDHVLLIGQGAEAFADEMGVERVSQDYFHTERRLEALERARAREASETEGGSTVGAVALDVHGDLAAATSTGGLTNKRFGRVGDVPIVGAGTFADNRSCAVSGTGRGEEFIRNSVAATISARMRLAGESLAEAVRVVVHETLEEGVGGVIAVDRSGEIVLDFNTPGMFRGAADSAGRFETAIW